MQARLPQPLEVIGRGTRLVGHPTHDLNAALGQGRPDLIHLLQAFNGAWAANDGEATITDDRAIFELDNRAVVRTLTLYEVLLTMFLLFHSQRRPKDFPEQGLDGFIAERPFVHALQLRQHVRFALRVIELGSHFRAHIPNLRGNCGPPVQQLQQLHIDVINL